MPKYVKKLGRKLRDNSNPSQGTGPLAGPDLDKLFKGVADEPPPLGPVDSSAKTEDMRNKKKKKSIFDA